MSDFLLTVVIVLLLALLLASGGDTKPVVVNVQDAQSVNRDTLRQLCSYDGADKIDACRGVVAPAVMQPLPTVAAADAGLVPQPSRDCPFVLSPARLQKCLNGEEY